MSKLSSEMELTLLANFIGEGSNSHTVQESGTADEACGTSYGYRIYDPTKDKPSEEGSDIRTQKELASIVPTSVVSREIYSWYVSPSRKLIGVVWADMYI